MILSGRSRIVPAVSGVTSAAGAGLSQERTCCHGNCTRPFFKGPPISAAGSSHFAFSRPSREISRRTASGQPALMSASATARTSPEVVAPTGAAALVLGIGSGLGMGRTAADGCTGIGIFGAGGVTGAADGAITVFAGRGTGATAGGRTVFVGRGTAAPGRARTVFAGAGIGIEGGAGTEAGPRAVIGAAS